MSKQWGIIDSGEPLWGVIRKSLTRRGISYELQNVFDRPWSDFRAWLESRDVFLTANCLAFHFWKHGAELEDYLAQTKKPVLVWHWEKVLFSGDPALKMRFHAIPFPQNFLFMVTDRADIQVLHQLGMKAVFLPLAVSDDLSEFRLKDALRERFKAPLSFVGTPLKLIEDAQQPQSRAEHRMRFTINAVLEFFEKGRQHRALLPPTKPLTEKLLLVFDHFFAQRFSNFLECQHGLNEIEREAKQIGLDPKHLEFLRYYRERLAFVYSYWQLVDYLNALRDKEIRVYGSEDWRRYLEGYTDETPRLTDEEFYSVLASSDIVFCLTKLQFDDFLHERSMMTLAVGGFPITDFRRVAQELFESDELVTYKTIEEARELIDYYRNHSGDRQRISEKGQKRVFQQHLYVHRVEQIEKYLKEYFE